MRRKHTEPGISLTLDLIRQIEIARITKNWTYADLEKRSGVDSRTIQSWLDSAARERATTGKPLRPRLLSIVTQALGMDTRLVRRAGFPPRRQDTVDVFLAAPMESLGDGYRSHRDGVLEVVRTLRETLNLSVFYAGEDRPFAAAFEDEAWALADNIDILERARRFVLIYPEPLPDFTKPLASSALIEVGYAIAIRLPVLVFFHTSFDTLPFLLRMLPKVFDGSQLDRYRDIADIKLAVKDRHRPFFPSGDQRGAPPN